MHKSCKAAIPLLDKTHYSNECKYMTISLYQNIIIVLLITRKTKKTHKYSQITETLKFKKWIAA